MTREEKAAELNARLRAARTLGDVGELIEEATEWQNLDPRSDRLVLTSKRAVWHSGRRELFAFTSSVRDSIRAGSSVYISNPASTRVAYLYNDAENHGEAEVKNLWRIAEFI